MNDKTNEQVYVLAQDPPIKVTLHINYTKEEWDALLDLIQNRLHENELVYESDLVYGIENVVKRAIMDGLG